MNVVKFATFFRCRVVVRWTCVVLFCAPGVNALGFDATLFLTDGLPNNLGHAELLGSIVNGQGITIGILETGTEVYGTLNFNSQALPNTYAPNEPIFPTGYVQGTGNLENYFLTASANVTVPAGEWSIAFGSSDGGQLTFPGANFVSTFNEDLPPAGGSALDQLFFNGDREHAWTGGHFSNATVLDVALFASMHARDGSDSFEIAIRDNSDLTDSTTVSAATGWMLLTDGAFGWNVVPASGKPRTIADINWVGGPTGDWNDIGNWNPAIVPNASSTRGVFDGTTVTVDLGPSDINSNFAAISSTVTVNSFAGTSMSLPHAAGVAGLVEQAQFRADGSQVLVNVPINLQDDTWFDVSTADPFSFTQVTFAQTIDTDGNNLTVSTEQTDSAFIQFNQTVQGDGSGIFVIDGTTSTGHLGNLNVDQVIIQNGEASFATPTGQTAATTIVVDGGGLFAGAGQTNPAPNLTAPIESRGGRIGIFEDGIVNFPQGVNLGPGNTNFDASFFPNSATLNFDGPLTREGGGILNVTTALGGTVFVDSVPDADANGILPFGIAGGDDFLKFDVNGSLIANDVYTTLDTAGPNDAAQAVGNTTLAANASASVIKVNSADLNGDGNSITADAFLFKGVNATLRNATIMPNDDPGNDPNELFLHAPTGGDRPTLDNINIVDNGSPTDVTFSSIQGGSFSINSQQSYTGETFINGGTLTLDGANAGLGDGNVNIDAASTLVLSDSTISNNILVDTGPFAVELRADGNSTITGNITITNNSGNDRDLLFTAVGGNDNLNIDGDILLDGAGNPVTGRGKVNLVLGQPFGTGDINLDGQVKFGDLTPFVVALQGNAGRDVFINGNVGPTSINGNVDLRGNGSSESVDFGDLTPFVNALIGPGQSLGTYTVESDVLADRGQFTYEAEVDDAGASDLLAVGGTLTLGADVNILDISFFAGSALADATYTLATYSTLVGTFDTVMFDGAVVADPTLPGALGGTHQLVYGATALLLATDAVLAGDYNSDGVVNAADYSVWRDNVGAPAGTLANDVDGGAIGAAQYATWRANFGASVGGSLAGPTATTIPEPAAVLLTAICLGAGTLRRGNRSIQRVAQRLCIGAVHENALVAAQRFVQ